MPCQCHTACQGIRNHFDHGTAERDLATYRRKGAGRTTVLLRDQLACRGGAERSLVDIGAGVGALTFELVKLGLRRALVIDASPAYLAAARQEAKNYPDATVTFLEGDFVGLAKQVSPADIVTLDRVVCCYPEYEALLTAATNLAAGWVALSYPHDRAYVRAAIWLENFMRLMRRDPFRAYVHPGFRAARSD
jgi:2-polyprenyl-3-methyl-5-hydroxy-6-metoxy-1,4-benzoquinol methylase